MASDEPRYVEDGQCGLCGLRAELSWRMAPLDHPELEGYVAICWECHRRVMHELLTNIVDRGPAPLRRYT